MPYSKDSVPRNHTEFGGGPGLIDPVLREDRVLTNEEQRMEIMFSNPDPPEVAHAGAGSADMTAAQRDRAMEARARAIELENDPATVPIPRIIVEND